jgi:Rieske Fe-S protein
VSEPARRVVLRAAVVTGATAALAPVLAGCRSGSTGSGPAGPVVSVPTSQVPLGGGVINQPGAVVVVQPTAGSFRAYSAICPHQGCLVNKVSGGEIFCPCHGSIFTVSDGSVVRGPATQPLTQMAASVRGDEVVVTGYANPVGGQS